MRRWPTTRPWRTVSLAERVGLLGSRAASSSAGASDHRRYAPVSFAPPRGARRTRVASHPPRPPKQTGRKGPFVWRRGWDSNPRYGKTVHRISNPAHSTTLPPLHTSISVAFGGTEACCARRIGSGITLASSHEPSPNPTKPAFDHSATSPASVVTEVSRGLYPRVHVRPASGPPALACTDAAPPAPSRCHRPAGSSRGRPRGCDRPRVPSHSAYAPVRSCPPSS